MVNWEITYERWLHYKHLDSSVMDELEKLKEDQMALEDAFYQELTFGTGGMRGILGPGINRMNIYTIRKSVTGLANYLKMNSVNIKDRGVVIAYDSRYMSKEFALESAKVLGVFGIKTYIFNTLRPTPLLSFAVRYLGTAAGIMVTASHNPPEYNGFKVYNEDGGQITLKEANGIIESVHQIEDELSIPVMEEETLHEKGLLKWVGDEVDHAYLENLQKISKLTEDVQQNEKDVGIVFTPLHGTAHNLVMKGLRQLNFSNVSVVEEQVVPDPEFSTVESPNPEEPQAFTLAIEQGKKNHADILLATDPDADRLGIAVKDKDDQYKVLTGNQIGALLLDYILSHSDPVYLTNARVLKTIVTTELGRSIAHSYGVKTVDTLTGFKFIGEKIRQYDATGENFIFGFEESYGYLMNSFSRDKDAVQAAMMACEMTYYWKQKNMTLVDALNILYAKHGFYLEGITSLTLQGIDGSAKINAIMDHVRQYPLQEIANLKVEAIEDYLLSERKWYDPSEKIESIDLPQENVVKFLLEQDSWVCLRPSGTEPKIKCYYGVKTENADESKERLAHLQEVMEETMDNIIHSYE